MTIAIATATATTSTNIAMATNSSSLQSHHGGSTNVFNVTVDCNNGTQMHTQKSSSSNTVANINVTCTGGGGTVGKQGPPGPQGVQGPPGPPGQNATLHIITEGSNATSTSTSTSAPPLTAPALVK